MNKNNTDAEKITAKEFSEATGIPRQTIDRWRNDGKIVGTNLSGKWFYNKDQIEVAKSIRAQNLKSQTDLQKSDTTTALPQLVAAESEADTTAAQIFTVSIDSGSGGAGDADNVQIDANDTNTADTVACDDTDVDHSVNDDKESRLVISLTEFNGLRDLVDEIRGGKVGAADTLKARLKEWLNVDADTNDLISIAACTEDLDYRDRFYQYLARFSPCVISDDGERYILSKSSDGKFVLSEATDGIIDGDRVAALSEPTDETKTLSQRAERIRQLQADVQRGIIEIGFELIAAKKEIRHGGWTEWLEKEFDWTQQTANRFMRVAQRFGNLNVQFKSSTLQAMLALPTGEEEDFIAAQAECGNPVENQSAREVQRNIRDWKQLKAEESSPCKIFSSMPTPDNASPVAAESPAKKTPVISLSTGNCEWYTPKAYIEAARRVLGDFDLDPASCPIANQIVKAKEFLSADDDGLAKQWRGRIWLNPPYKSGLIDKFVDKLLASDFEAAIVVVDNATETRWFRKLAQRAAVICFTDHRINFLRADGSQGKGHHICGSAFFYFGVDTEKFISAFQPFGWFTQSYQIGAMNHE